MIVSISPDTGKFPAVCCVFTILNKSRRNYFYLIFLYPMRKPFLLLILFSEIAVLAVAQPVDKLFRQRNNLSADYRTIANKYGALELDAQVLSSMRSSAPASMRLQVPFENGQLKLELQRITITSQNFSVIEALPDGQRRTVSYNDGIFYQGKIEGKNRSLATISIFENQVMGVIADEQSNIILGAIERNGKGTSEYSIYRETDLIIANPFVCGTGDTPVDADTHSVQEQHSGNRVTAVGEPVDIYLECDYKFYTDKGSNTNNVINYVLGFFNSIAQLYDNENIKVQVSQILVWTTQDPEAAAGLNTTGAVLPAFRDRMNTTNYVGDYAHFLSTRSLGGGIAYLLSNPCSSAKRFRSAVSAISNSYNNFPTYSWTVQVVTHELGHNFGSNHTQWCGWTGGALDNCYTTEGSCDPGPAPSGGGTIMSYCHLTSNGINFNNGFGTQPGDRIRSVIGNAACFGNCRMTIEINKTDASCGQSNGSATVTASNNTGSTTYTWSNGQTGSTLSDVGPGTYNVTVADASGCQVMGVVTITNSGPTLNVTLTPNTNTAFCTGGNVPLSVTFNAAYSYQWRRNGAAVGTNSNTYMATSGGNYSVTVTAGSCIVTRSVEITEVAIPAASINPGGSISHCDDTPLVLDAGSNAGYSYQWYRNGNTISGATASTYSVTQTGNYTVRIYASNCESTSSPVSVTVNPAPAATVTAGSSTSFCSGGNVTLNASTGSGYSYQWYRNGSLISGAGTSSFVTNSSGNYTVRTTHGSCVRTSAGTIVTVWANPSVAVSPAISTIEKFQTQSLTGTGANNYNWATQPALVNSNVNIAVFMPLTTTSYTIEGTDLNGCKGTANALVNVIGCGDVTNITATVYSPSRAILRWTNPDGANTDTLRYRKAGNSTWISIFVTGEEYELNGLEPGASYEFSITPLCNTTTVFVPSETKTFNTPGLEDGIFLRLYPNPISTDGKLEVVVDKPFSLQIGVYNNYGKKIANISPKENFSAGQVIKAINSTSLPNSIYYVVATINGKNYTVKMQVIH